MVIRVIPTLTWFRTNIHYTPMENTYTCILYQALPLSWCFSAIPVGFSTPRHKGLTVVQTNKEGSKGLKSQCQPARFKVVLHSAVQRYLDDASWEEGFSDGVYSWRSCPWKYVLRGLPIDRALPARIYLRIWGHGKGVIRTWGMDNRIMLCH